MRTGVDTEMAISIGEEKEAAIKTPPDINDRKKQGRGKPCSIRVSLA